MVYAKCVLKVCAKCVDDQEATVNEWIQAALR